MAAGPLGPWWYCQGSEAAAGMETTVAGNAGTEADSWTTAINQDGGSGYVAPGGTGTTGPIEGWLGQMVGLLQEGTGKHKWRHRVKIN